MTAWLAVAAGFIGVLVIIRPDAEAISLPAAIVLVSACFSAKAICSSV